MMENYPLKCNFCGAHKKPTDEKMFAIEISQILYDPHDCDGGEVPHVEKPLRHMQICKSCLSKSDIQIALVSECRGVY